MRLLTGAHRLTLTLERTSLYLRLVVIGTSWRSGRSAHIQYAEPEATMVAGAILLLLRLIETALAVHFARLLNGCFPSS